MEKEPEIKTEPAEELIPWNKPFPPLNKNGNPMPAYLADIITPFNDRPLNLHDNGESVDDYWANGWTLGFCTGSRSDWDYIGDELFKVFPTRYRLDEFHLTKSMRRVMKKNADLEYVVRPLRVTPEKEKLYFDHHVKRFHTAPTEPLIKRYDFIVNNPSTLMEISYFDADRLIALSIFEVGDRAVYSNSGPWSMSEHHRCLGTFTILKEIEHAMSRNCNYYYLGFYYTQNPSYAYKTRFPGLELYDWRGRRWIRYDDPYAQELLRDKFTEDEVC